jgi:undecaprenyl diphosphate synthase
MKVPRHIALIPDGNRRWAEEKGLKPWEGHAQGMDKFREFLDWCYDMGVEKVTAYSLSKENFEKRSKEEIDFLFKAYEEKLRELLTSKDFIERGIRIKFIGKKDNLPKGMKDLIAELERESADFTKRRVNLCINYSGRQELLDAAKSISESGEEFNKENFEKNLLIRDEPDLLIRTAEKRISNYLLWQLAYSEIHFSPKLFPDFTKDDLLEAIAQYDKTERRYGR